MKSFSIKTATVIAALILANVAALAKEMKVSGIVTDAEHEPLVGATVMLKGTGTGVMTDLDGRFELNAGSDGVLIVSYVGYRTREVPVDGQSSLSIILDAGSNALDEVVVVGYGHQKKVNLSGSVSSINVAELQDSRPVTNISQALVGQAAGVRVTMSSNQPGNDGADIKIRGTGTLNNASPLVIIDGMEAGITSVSPQDIESISVLKDAASAAIYGSRAANGVVLITTKKGEEGKLTVNYTGYVSFQSMKQNIYPVTDYATYMELINEGYENAGNGPNYIYSQETIEDWRLNSGRPGIDPVLYPNNDWFKMTFRNAVSNTHTVSLSGGSEKIKVYGSFSYLDNPGVIINSGFKKYSARIKVDGKVNRWLTLGLQASGYLSDREVAGGDLVNDIFSSASNTSPGITFVLPDGRMGASPNFEEAQTVSSNNPIARTYRLLGGSRAFSVRPRFYAIVTPFKGFSLTGSYTMNVLNTNRREKPAAVDYWDPQTEVAIYKYNPQSKLTYSNSQSWRYFNDLVARYDIQAGKMGIGAMVGMSHELYRSQSFSATREGIIDESLWDLKAAAGDSNATGTSSEWAMTSYFGRVNLDWDSKYLIELNLRVDGSSRFHRDRRWGWFPSGSAAWRMEQEPFMESLTDKGLDNLKIRVSYGSLGNNAVGNYEYQSLYTNTGMNYVLNGVKAPGMVQVDLANSALTWERTYVADAGLDFGFFNNRLTGTADYFHKRTKNILISLPAPLVHGNRGVPTVNAAEVTNQGFEVTLGWRDRIKDFTYGVSANLTYIRNRVTKYKGKGEDGRTISGQTIIWEGHPIGAHYLLECDRIVQTEEDLALVNAMIENAPEVDGVKVNPFQTYGTPGMGDLLYRDINGDGVIDADDRSIVSGGSMPNWNLGLSIDAGWKGIDFSILFDGSFGAKAYWNSGYMSTTVAQGKMINKKVMEGRWTDGRTDATFPRLYPSSGEKVNTRASTFYLQSLDWLKIRNIQIGYTLPRKWSRAAMLSKVRVYCSLENFFTFTSYDGFDPETGNAYPVMRQVAVGLNVSF